MLVEDDIATYSALRTLISRRGWDVSVATTVSEGQVLLETQPACLILDLMLPDGDGGAILQEIRRRELPIKVIVQTGVNDSDWLSRIRGLSPDLILRKPIDLRQLIEFLQQYQN